VLWAARIERIPLLDNSVLVLNQNYEPLSVCSVRRALLLILRGRAEAVEQADGSVRSASQTFAVPSVVRLGRYINAPRRSVVLSKRNVLRRDRFQCQYCGRRDGMLTVDHIVPRTKGGPSTWENMVCACTSCNNKKGEKRPEQVGLKLRSQPKRPSSVRFMREAIGSEHPLWKPYLFAD
jgi:5-methylcytosine-specific restriction endonuclease McrA